MVKKETTSAEMTNSGWKVLRVIEELITEQNTLWAFRASGRTTFTCGSQAALMQEVVFEVGFKE